MSPAFGGAQQQQQKTNKQTKPKKLTESFAHTHTKILNTPNKQLEQTKDNINNRGNSNTETDMFMVACVTTRETERKTKEEHGCICLNIHILIHMCPPQWGTAD